MGQLGRTSVLLAMLSLPPVWAGRAAEIPPMPAEPPGAADFPLRPRSFDARIIAYDQAGDEEAVLPEGRFEDFNFTRLRRLEGRVTRIAYVFPDASAGAAGAPGLSSITIMNHYLDVLKGAGFAIQFRCDGAEGCGGFNFGERLTQPMAEAHAGDEGNLIIDFLHPVGNDIRYVLAALDRPEGRLTAAIAVARHSGRRPGLFIETVEEAQEHDAPPPVSATWIESALHAKGSVPLYAIRFDAGNARIRRDSRAVLEQVAHMLQANPPMKLIIVGHSDTSETMARGTELSAARAQAVMQMLIRSWKVPQAQISAVGVGPAAPVASNADPIGRALNQRIELVLQ